MIRYPVSPGRQQPAGSAVIIWAANPAQTGGGALAAGTLSFSGISRTGLVVSTTAATGGTAPYTYQFQRSPDNSTWANVGSASSATSFTDSGLTAATLYYYRVVVTDSATPTPGTATSASASVTTLGATRPYSWYDREASVPSGAGNTVLFNGPCRLLRILVTATGSAGSPVVFYDNATTNSGLVIGLVPGNATIGTEFSVRMPAQLGITVAGQSGSPALTVDFA